MCIRDRVSTQSTWDTKICSCFKKTDYLESRHCGPNEKETEEMLKVVGFKSLEEMMLKIVPPNVYDKDALKKDGDKLGEPITENDVIRKIKEMFEKNRHYKCYIGEGYYKAITPSILIRSMLENPVWYTSYTPYQAECSQGRLESLLNFQTVISELTGLPIANASLLDEGTAAAEAMALAFYANKARKNFFVSKNCFLQTIQVCQTRAKFLGINIIIDDPDTFDFEKNGKNLCGALVQSPDTFGQLKDFTGLAKTLKKHKAIPIIANDILALTISKTPAEMGFDISVGSTQRLGTPLGFGGPHASFFATVEKHLRKMPGRIIGKAKDVIGNSCYRMALQTREQHIKREKAISNICTSQALLANITAMYAIYHGPLGLTRIAKRINLLAQELKRGLIEMGYKIYNTKEGKVNFFDTVCIEVENGKAKYYVDKLLEKEINIRKINENMIGFSLDETTTMADIIELLDIFGQIDNKSYDQKRMFITNNCKDIALELSRKNKDFMKQKVFSEHQTESKLQRYIHQLQDRDISLTKSMIPLGSCTMKLNPVTTLLPLSFDSAQLHPFVPLNQALGYKELLDDFNKKLQIICKFDEFCFQPNSGAQGEYSGLLTIKNYLMANGQKQRNICLLPKSAHGTNPASAVMCGLKPVVVETKTDGSIDIADLKKNIAKNKGKVACIMVTYPSTYGVYEGNIRELINLVHEEGGQVYMDGANMNGQIGYTSPGFLNADVCHLNIHKTFSTPHGGGGPGMGPIGVKSHLIKYLPGHFQFSQERDPNSHYNSVASAPYSSASILPVGYAYVEMLGKNIKKSTEKAILNANYMKKKLQKHFKIVFEINGLNAHEFILDIRPFNKYGIKDEDVAKRLMDFGFHAPTQSFPVPGTLMVEPTESEDKGELDRYIDAFIKIRGEIQMIIDGKYDKVDNPLKNAPHSQEFVLINDWNHKYSRQEAAYPLPWVLSRGKIWPGCCRIDNVSGDKNLICKIPN
eukprot:TRINITY_DN585_c0_g1_i10.p1 TRINITY_DN585_c0_g1~~TRINITY_DN585_c0_g1_i10.p1  ORF type:complete len:1001 (+),score=385.15 TRINITY_DN585_c0_g1_i10:64-3003(+)